MKQLNLIVNILLIIGGINLGMIGLAHYDIIGTLLAHSSPLVRLLYTLIGIAAIVKIVFLVGKPVKK